MQQGRDGCRRWRGWLWLALLGFATMLGCEALQGETPCASDDECPATTNCDLATGLCREQAGIGTDAAVIDAAVADSAQPDAGPADTSLADQHSGDAASPDQAVADAALPDQSVASDHGDHDLDASVTSDVIGQDRAPEDSGVCGACSLAEPICGPANSCVECTGDEHCNGRPCSSANICVECTGPEHCAGRTCQDGHCVD